MSQPVASLGRYDRSRSSVISLNQTGITGLATTVTGLTDGQPYSFAVTATNAAGVSATGRSNWIVPRAPQPTAPDAPSAVSATAGDARATVRWDASENDGNSSITAYTVTSSPGGLSCATTGTSCTVHHLTNGTSYTFVVHAANAYYESAAATSNPVTPRGQSSVWFSSTSSPTSYGHAVRIVAKIDTSGAPAAGDLVALQYRHSGSQAAFRTLETAKATSARVVTFAPIRPSSDVELRLALASGPGFVGSTSAVRMLSVRRAISLAVNHPTVHEGNRFVLAGDVHPADSSARVVLERKVGRTWQRATSQATSRGRYSFTVRAAKRGWFTYRVAVAVDTDFAASVSETRTVTVV